MNAEERLEIGRKIVDELILDPHIYGNREYVATQIASVLIPYEAQARKEALREAAEHFRGLTPSTIGYYSQDKGFERDGVVEEIEKLMEDEDEWTKRS